MIKESPGIYNIFPRLLGPVREWSARLDRIKDMGFNWIYLNPFQYSGFSGSLYSIKDYYGFNPLFTGLDKSISPEDQVKKFIISSHRHGIKVMMDLVINHTAKDHPFTTEHPGWYKKNDKGEIQSPGAWDNGQWTEWGDLAEIDNENSTKKYELWNYWKDLLIYNLGLGFDGFRADAAYSVPGQLWEFLIGSAVNKRKDVIFFAESLGCSIDKTIELAEAGFNFIFNSSKWWNYRDEWLLDQYTRTRGIVSSVSFPESHDTARLAFESGGNIDLIKQRTLFTAFFSSGWMIPIGFEYGFLKKLDVVKTNPGDWENVNIDLTGFIKEINNFKKSFNIFNEESEVVSLNAGKENDILVLLKSSEKFKEKALILLNRSKSESYSGDIRNFLPGCKTVIIFPGKGHRADIKEPVSLKPLDVKIIYCNSK